MKTFGLKGDTLVEVLISITIVSTILGGAYASSNASLTTIRQAQERAESLKLAEQQLERLIASVSNSSIYTTQDFCLNNALQIKTPTTDPACQQAPQGGVVYKSSIRSTGDDIKGYTFTVTNTWDRAGGGGTEETKLIYRLHR